MWLILARNYGIVSTTPPWNDIQLYHLITMFNTPLFLTLNANLVFLKVESLAPLKARWITIILILSEAEWSCLKVRNIFIKRNHVYFTSFGKLIYFSIVQWLFCFCNFLWNDHRIMFHPLGSTQIPLWCRNDWSSHHVHLSQ